MNIRKKVAERVAKLGPSVEAQVVDELVEMEAARRVDAIIRGLGLLEDYEKSTRPDIVAYDAGGKEISAAYSKFRLDQLTRLKERVVRLTKALEKALDQGDMGDLCELLANGAPPTAEDPMGQRYDPRLPASKRTSGSKIIRG